LIFKAEESKTGVDWSLLSDLIKTLKLQHLTIHNQFNRIYANAVLLDTIAEHCADLITLELCDYEQFKVEKLKLIETKCVKLQKMTICSYYQNSGQKFKTKISINKSQQAVENHTSRTVEIYNGDPDWGNNEKYLIDLFSDFPQFDRIDIVNCNTFTSYVGASLLNNNLNLHEIRLSYISRDVNTSILIRDLLTKNTQMLTLTCQLFETNIKIYKHEKLERLNLYTDLPAFFDFISPLNYTALFKQIITQCPKLCELRLFCRNFKQNHFRERFYRENQSFVTFREVNQEFFWEQLEWQCEEEK
jgi:hypothetical protein